MRDDAIERLFSLLTSPDRAAAMAGDLVEEREQRGRTWFWLHVAGVAFALWRGTVREAPLRVLALVLAGLVLFAAPGLAGAAAVGLFPQILGSAVSGVVLALFWLGGAYWTGTALTAAGPRHGFSACAILAVLAAALSMTTGGFSAVALGTAVALVAGGATAPRRPIALGVPFAFAIGITAIVIIATTAIPLFAAPQDEWRDPSPHAAKLVAVDTDVQLEVLDWGGSGPAIVLLAGLGDTAHVFDDFAPMLTARYRVVGVTRRGHGRSSAPLTGYGFPRLAEDVVRVIDTLGLARPVVAGHSFAGEELHVLGARHAGRIAGLIYVDAAFDRGDDADNAAYDAVARTLPAAPARGPADMASFAALRSYLERTQGFAGPEAHLRARWVANPDGTIARLWAPDAPIRQAMTKEMQAAYRPYAPEPVRVTALALYAAPKSPADLMRPWFPTDDAALRERVEKLYGLQRARVENHMKWFEKFAGRPRIVEINGAHHLFLSHPREVLQQIDAFMAAR